MVIPSGHLLQRLRSDRGGEYTRLEYREYCLQTGIKQEFAATHTPQQNGISEREWASLRNMTRCFLAEADALKYLWQEAFRMAVYLSKKIVSRPPRWEVKRFSRCGTVEHLRDLSTFELLVPEISCMKSDTSRS